MDNPDYIKELFNVLKNETRLQILQAIVGCRYSVSRLQLELRKAGHKHSQDTINKEYLRPLMAVGLAIEAQDEYYATTFGGRISKLLEPFPELAEKLPAHSECYEEILLQSLLSGTKTFEDVEAMIFPKITARILQRLRSAGLIKTPVERDYIFFFKSKRDSNKETFTSTERKIYDIIACEGTPAGKLAKNTGLSMRRTYKVLRALKGKKLVFARTIPKAYSLTSKGEKLALLLQELQQIVEDTWNSSGQVMQEATLTFELAGLSDYSSARPVRIEQNKQERQKSMQEAFKIVNPQLAILKPTVKADSVSEIVSDLLSRIENNRQRELAKAFDMMGKLNERQRKIINNLTSVLLKQTFMPVVNNFRRAVANDEKELIDVASKLFEVES
jgi:predicted transcriptional regulator